MSEPLAIAAIRRLGASDQQTSADAEPYGTRGGGRQQLAAASLPPLWAVTVAFQGHPLPG